jgi:hypothetical protein
MCLDNDSVSATFSFEGLEQAQLNVVSCSIPTSAEPSRTTNPNSASTTELFFELECVLDEAAHQIVKMLYEMRVRIPYGTLTFRFSNNGRAQYTFGTFSGLVIRNVCTEGERDEQTITLSIIFESFRMEYRNDFYEEINSR